MPAAFFLLSLHRNDDLNEKLTEKAIKPLPNEQGCKKYG
jgi:hypothetical protein